MTKPNHELIYEYEYTSDISVIRADPKSWEAKCEGTGWMQYVSWCNWSPCMIEQFRRPAREPSTPPNITPPSDPNVDATADPTEGGKYVIGTCTETLADPEQWLARRGNDPTWLQYSVWGNWSAKDCATKCSFRRMVTPQKPLVGSCVHHGFSGGAIGLHLEGHDPVETPNGYLMLPPCWRGKRVRVTFEEIVPEVPLMAETIESLKRQLQSTKDSLVACEKRYRESCNHHAERSAELENIKWQGLNESDGCIAHLNLVLAHAKEDLEVFKRQSSDRALVSHTLEQGIRDMINTARLAIDSRSASTNPFHRIQEKGELALKAAGFTYTP